MFKVVKAEINKMLSVVKQTLPKQIDEITQWVDIKYQDKRDCKSDNKRKLGCCDWLELCLFPICSVLICVTILLQCDCSAIRGVSVVMLVCSLLTIVSVYCYRR